MQMRVLRFLLGGACGCVHFMGKKFDGTVFPCEWHPSLAETKWCTCCCWCMGWQARGFNRYAIEDDVVVGDTSVAPADVVWDARVLKRLGSVGKRGASDGRRIEWYVGGTGYPREGSGTACKRGARRAESTGLTCMGLCFEVRKLLAGW